MPLVRRLIATHPRVPARLLIGNETISDNPKLNNVCKGWRAAAHDWIVMADSNVLMPRDYIQRLLAAWRADTGLVASPPVGCRPDGFWAELECAFLNTYQARWQYMADSIGLGFAQGKSMLYRKQLTSSEPAASGCWRRSRRRTRPRPRSCAPPACAFASSRRRSSSRSVIAPPARCGRVSCAGRGCGRHRSSVTTLLEILAGGVAPLAAATYVVAALGLPLSSVIALAAIWYGAEAALAYAAGWQLSLRSPLAWMLRDLLLPCSGSAGWLGSGVVWRGHHVRTAESEGTI